MVVVVRSFFRKVAPWFDDVAIDEKGLFGISDRGNQPVEIYSTQATGSGVASVAMFDVESDDLLTESDPPSPLGVGEQLGCGLDIDTHDVSVQTDEYDVSLVINAKAPNGT